MPPGFLQCAAFLFFRRLFILNGRHAGARHVDNCFMTTLDRSPFGGICTELLNMERAAFETYTEALEFYGDDPMHSVFLSIRSAHDENVDYLAEQLGASALELNGPRDAFSGAVEGASRIFGEGAALMALQAGEAQAADAYQNAIANNRLPRSLRDDLRDKLLPRVKANLLELEMARADETASRSDGTSSATDVGNP